MLRTADPVVDWTCLGWRVGRGCLKADRFWSSIQPTSRGIQVIEGQTKRERLGERDELRKNNELRETNNAGLSSLSNFAMWFVTPSDSLFIKHLPTI